VKFNDINQTEIEEVSNKDTLFSIIESLLFVCGEPIKLKDLSVILECGVDYTKALMGELADTYEDSKRGIKIININDEYQFITKPQNSDFIQKLLKTNTRQSLSQASLETLAIIAYKQPITRVDIDEIRGVKSDSAVMKLLERNLIRECGRLDAPGRPIQYATTEEFLKQFNLEKLDQLMPLDSLNSEILDEALFNEEEVATDTQL
jgi:segregation and condensation protein B